MDFKVKRKSKYNFIGLDHYDNETVDHIFKLRDSNVGLISVSQLTGIPVEQLKKDFLKYWLDPQQQPELSYSFLYSDKIVEEWNKGELSPDKIVEKYKLQSVEHLWMVLQHNIEELKRPLGTKPRGFIDVYKRKLRDMYNPKTFFSQKEILAQKPFIHYKNRSELLKDLPELRKYIDTKKPLKN